MITEFARDAAFTAAIFGFFSAAWFGWAQEDPPPPGWRPWLVAGSIAGLVVAVAGGIQVWRNWSSGTVFDADTSPIFGLIVLFEVLLAGLGAFFLSRRGRRELVAPWVAVVVGVHFIPMAPLLGIPFFYVVGAVVTILGLASLPLARSRDLSVTTVTGALVGTGLLLSGVVALLA